MTNDTQGKRSSSALNACSSSLKRPSECWELHQFQPARCMAGCKITKTGLVHWRTNSFRIQFRTIHTVRPHNATPCVPTPLGRIDSAVRTIRLLICRTSIAMNVFHKFVTTFCARWIWTAPLIKEVNKCALKFKIRLGFLSKRLLPIRHTTV